MDFFNVLTVEQAKEKLNKIIELHNIDSEVVKIDDALNRVAAEDIVSKENLPEFNRSTVDGYAVISSDVMGASESIPSFLSYIDEVLMGEKIEKKVESGQAIYVPTGGMLPEGADGVVMIEYSEKLDEETLLLYRPIAPGENVSYVGDDLRKGELILNTGRKISPYDIGLLAGLGISEIRVYKKPIFSILSTGDEIVDIDDKKSIGKIRDINGYALSALVESFGGELYTRKIVKDDFQLLKETLGEMINKSDVVLISGGSSVGVRDYTKNLIESFDGGEVLVHGVSVKPGKPTIIGNVNKKLVFGLPGHPASALMIFNVFVKEYFDNIYNKKSEILIINAELSKNVHSAPGKETYQMVSLQREGNKYLAVPIYAKSGMISLLSQSSGYIRITNEKEGLIKGDIVEVNLLQEVYI